VISAWIGNSTATNALSGTSQAAPHVAGIVAYLAANNASLAQDPAAMKGYLRSTALSSIVTGATIQGDLGLLVNNGVNWPA
jgi:cerevisin